MEIVTKMIACPASSGYWTEVDTDAKGRFMSFKVTPSHDRVLCVYTPSGYSTREQLVRGHFFKDYKIIWKIKNEGNENEMILGDFNCTMDKMDRVFENKTQILYRCCFNYTLSKLIVNNGLEDQWRTKNSDSPEFTRYDRSFGKDPGWARSMLI